MSYHYLITLNGTVKLLVNEQEMPTIKGEKGSVMLASKIDHYNGWLTKSKEYDFASRQTFRR